jgi:hypothetical protein
MAERDDLLLWGGLGLVGAGAVMYLTQQKTAAPSGSGTAGSGSAGTTPPAGGRQSLRAFIQQCRPDIVGALNSGAVVAVLGQYLREQWPDFLARPDVAANPSWEARVGQWLREVVPSFWNRSDIQQAWPSNPAVAVAQYLAENGAPNCPGVSWPPPLGTGAGAGPGTGTGVTGLAGTGSGSAKAPIARWQDIRAGMIVALSCRYGDANYLVEPAGIGLDLMPYGYEPAHRRRRWIASQSTWNKLTTGDVSRSGARNVIILVTWPCLQAIAPGPDLRWGAYRGGVGWLSDAPRIAPWGGAGGYCA